MKVLFQAISLTVLLSIAAFAQIALPVTTMQNAATANGNGTAIVTTDLTTNAMFGGVGFQITGTFSATINFEVTFDGANWVSVMATSLADDSRAASTTTSGAYSILLNGAIQARARISNYTSGSVTVVGHLVPGLVSRASSGGGGGGSGTVTSVSVGSLSPLFTTSIANSTTTPALSFSLSNAAAHKFFGNNTGSTGAPDFFSIGTGDLPSGIPYANLNLTGAILNADLAGSIANAKLANSSINVTGTTNQVNVSGSPVSLGGTVTLSLPQNVDTSAAFQVARIGLGAAASSVTPLKLSGVTLNTDADGTVANEDSSWTLTKNDTNTRTFYGRKYRVTLNPGASNANTTVNLFDLDTTNTTTTGVTTNLMKLAYGGSQKFLVDSAGNGTFAGTITVGGCVGCGGGITVGTTAISGGTSGRVGYNNAGVYGEMTTSGTGTTLALTAGPTFTGTVAGAAFTASSTITQTSNSATAFESGPNGGTNPVLRLVNSTASQADGLSITGLAAGSGVTLTALSSGSNAPITLTPKGTSGVLVNTNGSEASPYIKGAAGRGFYEGAGGIQYTDGTARVLMSNTLLMAASNLQIGWSTSTSTQTGQMPDTIMRRAAAANLAFGAADAASPVAQTLSVQNVVAGTSNTAGVDWTFKGSAGTGTGAGGKLIFQTAPAGSTGTAQNSFVTGMTLQSDGVLVHKGVTFANLPTQVNGGVIYCSDCTIASPCASGGTGALAKGINGAWVCN